MRSEDNKNYYKKLDSDREFNRDQDRQRNNFQQDQKWKREETRMASDRAWEEARAHNLAGIARAYGMYDLAKEILESHFHKEPSYTPESPREHSYNPTPPPTPTAIDYKDVATEKIEAQDYLGAIAELDAAIALDQTLGHAYYLRAHSHAQLGDIDAAITDYSNAIRHGCDGWFVYRDRANAYDRKNEYEKAISDFSEALRQKPMLSIYKWPGFVRLRQGNSRTPIK